MSHILDTQFRSITLFLDSRDTFKTHSNSDCEWLLQKAIYVPTNIDILFSLDNITVPFSFYTVNSYNNYLHYTDPNGIDRSFSVTPGNYTVTNLLETINASLVDLSVSYSYITNKVTFISTTDTFDFTLLSDSTIFTVLGFSAVNHESGGGSIVSDQTFNLAYTTGIYIDLNDITTENIDGSNGGITSILSRVPIDQMPGSILQYSAKNNMVHVTNKYIHNLHITLLDDEKRSLLLQDNVYFNVTLTLHFITRKHEVFDNKMLLTLQEHEEKKKSNDKIKHVNK